MGDRRWSDTPLWEAPALAVIACVAVALRFVRLDLGWFGVDQARDVAIALDIVTGRAWPTIGPTMRHVTRLGALYHYFWALPYLASRDPIAGNWFAACLSTAALLLTWYVARRSWGPHAGVVTAAVAAAHPVWLIDGRMYWAPAALPFMAALLTVAMLGPLRRGRMIAIGALVGIAVQLHLTMVAWAAGVALLVLVDRVRPRVLLPGIVAAALVGAPALWAMLTASATAESGLAALPSRAPHPALTPRLAALVTLPARIVAGLGGWTDVEPGGWLLGAATLVVAIAIAAGLVRLLWLALRGDRPARAVLVPGLVTSLLVISLPGDAWYYYLDSALPLWALAAGALFVNRETAARAPARTRAIGIVAVLAASGALAICTADWLWRVAADGYMTIDPSRLTLDGRPGRDAAAVGRVTTLAVKRQAALLAAVGGDFDGVWQRLHGPALADATGDNGFWLRWTLEHVPPRPSADTSLHVGFWYGDDPTARALAHAPPSAAVERTRIGPLLGVRYRPAIDYAACRGDGVATLVPIRIAPDPHRYGDGTPALPTALPARLTCPLRADADGSDAGATDSSATTAAAHPQRRIVAALGGEGTVALAADGRDAQAAQTAALCVPTTAAAVHLAIERPRGAPAELDLYDVPLGIGCDDSGALASPAIPGP